MHLVTESTRRSYRDMNRKGAEYVCTLNATPRSPFFARCQPRSTSFSSGKIAICNRANLSNRLTTSLCRKRGAANRRIDGIVMNDSRAPSPILPGHFRPSPTVAPLPFPRRFPVRGVVDCRIEEFTITRNVFIGFGRAVLFCLSFPPFFRLPFHGGSPSNRWRLSSPHPRPFFFAFFFLFFLRLPFFIPTPANELKEEVLRD